MYLGIRLLRNRGDFREHYHNFISMNGKSINVRVKRFHSNNAAKSMANKESMERLRLSFTASLAYKSRSNGLAERLNRTWLNRVRAMMRTAHLNDIYLG